MDVFGLGIRIKEEGAATVQASLKRLAGQMLSVTAVVGGVGLAFKKMVDESIQLQAEQAALVSVLKSTNGVSGQTIETLNEHADALQKVTAFSGGTVSEVQKLLLTFTNIRGSFKDATVAALDLSQRLGMDVNSAAMMVGKALNDPVAGITALSRAGVQFSPVQKQMIEQFIKQNDIMGAQKIILGELNTQVGGAAEAYRNTLGGALTGVKNAFDDLFEVSAQDTQGLTDALNGLANWMPKIRDELNVTAAYWNWRFTIIGKIISGVSMHIDALRFAYFKVIDALQLNGPEEIPALTQARKEFEAARKEFDAYILKVEEAHAKLGNAYNAQQFGTKPAGAATAPPPEAKTAGKSVLDAVDEIAKLRLQRQQEREADQLKRSIDGFKKYVDEKKRLQAEADAAADAARREGIRKSIESDLMNTAALFQGFLIDVSDIQVPPLDQALIRQLHLEGLKATLADGIRDAIEGGIMSGLEMAIVSGRIGDAFKAMGQAIVRSMASAMVRVALEAIKFGTLLESIRKFMIAHPAIAVASAIALLALARSMGGTVTSGSMGAIGGAGGLSYGISGAASPAQQIIFGATSATTAAGMTPRQSMNVTIIGPNDPTAQRAIQELMNKANSRGSIG